jgi:E3 ubiquitin-protein ligase HERC2
MENELASLPNTAGSVYRSLTNSLSMSMSLSSCNATQKHSKMSASAMSVMAATMNNQEEVMQHFVSLKSIRYNNFKHSR